MFIFTDNIPKIEMATYWFQMDLNFDSGEAWPFLVAILVHCNNFQRIKLDSVM